MYQGFITDAVLTLMHAIKMLQEDGDWVDNWGSYLDCATDPPQRWQHGNKILEYVKKVRYRTVLLCLLFFYETSLCSGGQCYFPIVMPAMLFSGVLCGGILTGILLCGTQYSGEWP